MTDRTIDRINQIMDELGAIDENKKSVEKVAAILKDQHSPIQENYSDIQRRIRENNKLIVNVSDANHEFLKKRSENNATYNVQFVGSVASDRKVIGRLVTKWKMWLRNTIGFFVEPVVKQQTAFNVTTVQCLNAASDYDIAMRDIAGNQAHINTKLFENQNALLEDVKFLAEKVYSQRLEIEELRNQIEEYEAKTAQTGNEKEGQS